MLEPRLYAMNTRTHVHELQAGEAWAHSGSRRDRVVLVEGEVLLQSPATELAGITIVPQARRVTAPAMLSMDEVHGLRAARRAALVVEEAPSLLANIRSVLARRLRPNAESAILASLTRGGAAW